MTCFECGATYNYKSEQYQPSPEWLCQRCVLGEWLSRLSTGTLQPELFKLWRGTYTAQLRQDCETVRPGAWALLDTMCQNIDWGIQLFGLSWFPSPVRDRLARERSPVWTGDSEDMTVHLRIAGSSCEIELVDPETDEKIVLVDSPFTFVAVPASRLILTALETNYASSIIVLQNAAWKFPPLRAVRT